MRSHSGTKFSSSSKKKRPDPVGSGLRLRKITLLPGFSCCTMPAVLFSAERCPFLGGPLQIHKAGLLTSGLNDAARLPILVTVQWLLHRLVPGIQWRDRAGIAPASLLTQDKLKTYPGPYGYMYSLVKVNLLFWIIGENPRPYNPNFHIMNIPPTEFSEHAPSQVHTPKIRFPAAESCSSGE